GCGRLVRTFRPKARGRGRPRPTWSADVSSARFAPKLAPGWCSGMLEPRTRATSAALPRRFSFVGQHLRHAHRHVLRCIDVQELVRAVRVAVRAEDAGDQELSFGV